MRQRDRRFRGLRRLTRGCVAVLVVLGAIFIAAEASVAAAARRSPSVAESSAVGEFLIRNGVPIGSRIHVAKVSAIIKTRFKVRSVVKVIAPERLPDPEDIQEIRKIIEKKRKAGIPIRFDVSKRTSELELLRQNILGGEVIKFHPSEKLGELELFFSKTRSLKVEIGYDMFYVKIGNNDCTFRSPSLRRQLQHILEPRKGTAGAATKTRSGGSRSSRATTR